MSHKIQATLSSLRDKWFFQTINLIYCYLAMKRTRKVLAYKYLRWAGIEIGGLVNPTPVDATVAKVQYVDYLDEKALKSNYTELKNDQLQKIDFICKADNLNLIQDNSQDFVIGNHLFEHLNNPIKTLLEWNRVLKNGGIIFMAIPDKRRTFDINRERTTLDHIVLDYTSPSSERDWEHYLEYAWINLEESDAKFEEAKRLLEIDYSIHYHVFVEEDVVNIIDWCNKNTSIKFETLFIKSTSKNPWDNEFIFILKTIK